MDGVTIEKADYIIAYYSNLKTLQEKKALRHHISTIKLEGETEVRANPHVFKNGLAN